MRDPCSPAYARPIEPCDSPPPPPPPPPPLELPTESSTGIATAGPADYQLESCALYQYNIALKLRQYV